jgi:uncharacterized protein (DUF1778 family)
MPDAILDQCVFELDEEQHKAFVEALENPPLPNAKLRHLMACRAPWEVIGF